MSGILDQATVPADLVLTHARVLTQDSGKTVVEDGALAIRGGKIIAVGPTTRLIEQYQPVKVWDLAGKLVLPGLINTHNHLFQTIMRGLGKDRDFATWLALSVRRLMPYLDEEAVYLAAMAGCLEGLRTGTTTQVDNMYANVEPQFADAVIRAFEDSGIRGVLARGINDARAFYRSSQPSLTWEPIETSLAEVDRLRSQYRAQPRIGFMLAPSGVWLMTRPGFVQLAGYARAHDLWVTMHMLESTLDDEFCLKAYGLRTMPFLSEIGFLHDKLLAVHAIRLQAEDLELLQQNGVKVSYNPVSNMILGQGVCPVDELTRRNILVGLGTDGAASNDSQNLLEAMKTGALLQKVHCRNAAALSAEAVFSMATIQGARTIGKQDEIGSLEPGKRADFIVVNLLRSNTTPCYDPISSLVYSGSEGNIDAVVVDGQILYEHGWFKKVDEEALMRRFTKKAMELYALAGGTA